MGKIDSTSSYDTYKTSKHTNNTMMLILKTRKEIQETNEFK